AAGAFQVGSFATQRWAEWNGHYRDHVRRFWRGDNSMTGPMATRLSGSSDLYQPSGRRPYHSINFITSHDGFPINDLVSYERKHNLANLEDNRDGDNNNNSANYGVEGQALRTQLGNNNAYCQDNQISWFDWNLVNKNAEMLRFTQSLIAFRRRQPNV